MPAVKLKPLPMKEALAFWKNKVPMSRDDFDELVEQVRAKGFYVSGLHRLDQVAEVQQAIYESLAEGKTFEAFKKRIPGIINQEKWSGIRLEIIYRTNVQSAYMAGRHAQMEKVSKTRPYWMYDAINDSRTRPAHRAMDGRVFRHDHPIWNTWYPPNGYRCRCGVTTLSQREIERDGLKVETEDPTGKLFEPLTPEGVKMPARLLMPDPGFSGNIGKEWLSGLSPTELAEQIEDLPMPAICKGGRGLFSDSICKPPLADIDKRHVLPVSASDFMLPGKPDESYIKTFLKEFGITDINGGMIHRLPCNIGVPINKGFFLDKETGLYKVKKDGREKFVKLLAWTIMDPYEIWQMPVKIKNTTRESLNLIRLFEDERRRYGGFAVFQLINGRFWRTSTAYIPKGGKQYGEMIKYLEKKRGGTLIYREELKDSRGL